MRRGSSVTTQHGAAIGSRRNALVAAMAKLVASEMVFRVASRTLQLFGGAGYRKNEPVERICRSVRANRILAGTSEIMRHNRRDTLRNSAGAHMTITTRQGGTP
jgi:alkylation response protein AidB-like acyl-CoA dehydrogenase